MDSRQVGSKLATPPAYQCIFMPATQLKRLNPVPNDVVSNLAMGQILSKEFLKIHEMFPQLLQSNRYTIVSANIHC